MNMLALTRQPRSLAANVGGVARHGAAFFTRIGGAVWMWIIAYRKAQAVEFINAYLPRCSDHEIEHYGLSRGDSRMIIKTRLDA
jgi:hypothetical protein